MKKFSFAALALVACSVTIQEHGKIKWLYSYDEALKVAKEQGKPLFLSFGFKG